MVCRICIVSILIISFYSCSNIDIEELSNSLRKQSAEANSSISINLQPTAKITLDPKSILKEGVPITFDAKDSVDKDGNIASYTWREEKKIIGTQDILTMQFSSGVHIIELEVKDNKGSIGVTRKQFTVSKDYAKIEFDLDNIEEIATLGAPTKEINQISIRDNYLYASSNDGNIYFWELIVGELVNPSKIDAHTDYEVNSFLLTSDKVVSGSNDNSIKIWNKEDSTLLQTLNLHTNTITSIVSNGVVFATSSLDKSISIISVNNNSLIRTLKGHKSPINHMVMIENFLISYSSDKIVKIWDMSDNYRNVNTIDLIKYKVDFMRVYKSNIVTASIDGPILIWDIFKGVVLKEIPASNISSLDVYQNNIIFALNNGDIKYVDIDTSKEVNIVTLANKATFIKSSEGVLAIGLDNFTIKLYGNQNNFRQR